MAWLSAERPEPNRILQRGSTKLVVPENVRGREFAALFAGSPAEVALGDGLQKRGVAENPSP